MKRTLRSGAYTLPAIAVEVCPILNPHADGRCRNDWRKAGSFEPGRYFVTVRVHDETDGDGAAWSYTTIDVRKLHGYGIELNAKQLDNLSSETGQAMRVFFEALVVDDTLDSAARYAAIEHYVDPVDVLVRLVEAGVVSDDAVRLAFVAQRQADAIGYELEEARDDAARDARAHTAAATIAADLLTQAKSARRAS